MKKRIIALVALTILMVSMIPFAQAECQHTYDNGLVLVWGSCTSPTVKRYTCTKCGHTYTSTNVPSHTYTIHLDWPATYTKTGQRTLTCTVCGCKTKEKLPMLKVSDASDTKKQTAVNYFGGKTLKYDKNKEDKNVKKLQKRLNELGYTVSEDGVYGKETKNAIKKLEKDYGLNTDDGGKKAGPEVMTVLYYK